MNMSELWAALLGYPTAVFTVLLGLALLYWLSVIVGALDIDLFGGEEGALDAVTAKSSVLEAAAAKGSVLDAAAGKGSVLDAAAAKTGAAEALDGGGDVDVDGDVDGALKGASGLLSALNLRRAPITVTFSIIVFSSWIFSLVGMQMLGPVALTMLPSWLFGTLVLVGAVAVSLPITSLATKPLEKVFRMTEGRKRAELVGTVCRIRTGSVDEKFGQAVVDAGGDELLVNVRIEPGDDDAHKLARGDRAIIIDYDQEREAYVVEAYDAMLEEEEAGKRARK